MFPINFANVQLVLLIHPLSIILAAILVLFLFWRAGRHELFESDFLFDVILVALVGAFLFGRLFDFVVRRDLYDWQLMRLVFFNVYGGFDRWGALVGAIVAVAVFLRGKRNNFWAIFDLAAAPMSLGAAIVSFGAYLASSIFKSELYLSLSNLVIFWILIRLETKKRHVGFFACFYLVATSVLILSLSFKNNLLRIGGVVPYEPVIGLSFLFFGSFVWYFLAKREVVADLKSLFAVSLLTILKLKRVLSNVGEADKLARSIILLPIWIATGSYFFAKMVWHEIFAGFVDFFHVLGVKKYIKK